MGNSFLSAFVFDQYRWSMQTFGPGDRTEGLLKHIGKEIEELRAAPTPDAQLDEWIDVLLLALDGALRCGVTPLVVSESIEAAQKRNFNRRWPPANLQRLGEPNEHVRDADGVDAADLREDIEP